MLNKSVFPKWEDVRAGYFTYAKQPRFRGYDEYGSPKMSVPFNKKLVIAHNRFLRFIDIEIVCNRKRQPTHFRYGYDGKFYPNLFEYSESGYEKLLIKIERTLRHDFEEMKTLLGE